VTGEEEIPEGVVAVLTPDAPDVLSHVSVRARNMRVLFATCHDNKPLDDIKVRGGRLLPQQSWPQPVQGCCMQLTMLTGRW
jgi:alpha-glucan,water dikinase